MKDVLTFGVSGLYYRYTMDKERKMRTTKYSEGIERVDGKNYQKAYIKVPADFFVDCPHCGEINECGENSHIRKCSFCSKEFYAEFNLPKAI